MWEQVIEVITVLGLAATKYLMGVMMAIVFGMPLWLGFLLTVGGGLIGAALFALFGEVIMYGLGFVKKKDEDKIRINKNIRRIVKIRRRFGMWGIALLTPVLLTVPVGAMVGIVIEPRIRVLLSYMAVSFVVWSALLFGVYMFLGINIPELIEQTIYQLFGG